MSRIRPLLALVAAGMLATPARAGEAAGGLAEGSVSLSRHHTTNALDATLAIPDAYTTLRGSLGRTIEHEFGVTRVEAQVEAKRFDRVAIEDDTAFAATSTTTVSLGGSLELRGSLSASVIDEGEEFAVGDAYLGRRTRKASLGAALQAGVQIAPALALVVDASATRQLAGDARFEHDLIAPARLDPDRDRFEIGGTLTRVSGDVHYGLHLGSMVLRSQAAVLLPAFTLTQHTAKAQAARRFEGGFAAALAAGVQAIRVAEADFSEVRPLVEAALETPLAANLTLRGALTIAYDSARTDDPVISWVRRAEAELAWQAKATIRLGAGAFAELRDNIGFGTRERLHGAFALAAWQATQAVSLVLRVDASVRRDLTLETQRRRVDVQLALTTAL